VELWQHRDLLYILAWRDIKIRYKQTVLGIAWVILQPLAMATVTGLFLGRLAKVPSEGMPYPLFAFAGVAIWQLFASALIGASNSVLVNDRLITKVYFPRLLVPLSVVVTSVLDFHISLLVLVVLMIYYRVAPELSLLAFPVLVFMAVLIALGAGLWLAALNVRYRDVRYTMGFLVQFWFLATPIAYPASIVSNRWQVWYGLNPMVGIVEGFRWAVRGSGVAPVALFAISACVTLVVFVSGLYYFRRTEETFADFI